MCIFVGLTDFEKRGELTLVDDIPRYRNDHFFPPLLQQLVQNGTCTEFDNLTDSVAKNLAFPTIHYYRINATIGADQMRHMLVENGKPRFYRNDGVDLRDITEVWKTGWGRCESSGSLAPHLDRSIPTECSN